MKKEEIALAFSVIAAGCSIVAICVANPRDSGLGLDYMGVIVGVLALLVTVLIGWQIYNSIEINHKVNGIEDVATQITNERMEKYGHTVKSFVLTLNTFALFERNIDEYAFNAYMEAIKEGLKGTDPDAISFALIYIHKIIDSYGGNKGRILSGKRNEYIKLISKVENHDNQKVLSYILNAVEIDISPDESKDEAV